MNNMKKSKAWKDTMAVVLAFIMIIIAVLHYKFIGSGTVMEIIFRVLHIADASVLLGLTHFYFNNRDKED